MATIISAEDLPQKVQQAVEPAVLNAMVAGANAKASRVAPCLTEADPDALAEAKLILMGALQRWSEAGAGALASLQQGAGPFQMTQTMDTRQRTGFNLWPSEIQQLQSLCSKEGEGKAFAVDTVSGGSNAHVPWCDLMFLGASCSCGTDIAGFPLYELG